MSTATTDRRPDAQTWVPEARKLRDAGWSVRRIARELGVTRGAVDYWLNRERSIASSVRWQRRRGYLPATPRKTHSATDTSSASTIAQGVTPAAPPRMVSVTVRMPQHLRDALQAVAEQSDRRLSDELRALARARVNDVFTTDRTGSRR
jgi:putative ATPase subunit gpP of terminase